MAFRKQPLALYIISLIIFLVVAILPVGFMLAQFVVRLAVHPSSVTTVLIDSRQLILLGRSLTIAVSATAVAFGLGLPVAIILSAKDLPCRRLFYFLVLVPILIPSYVMAGAWIHLLSPSGFINSILACLFGPSAKLTVFSVFGCTWCLGMSFFPIIAFIVAAGLSELDSSLNDIARLSTGRWGVFWHSSFPQMRPHLAASICLVMIFVLAQYGVPSLLGLNTYPVEIFAQFSAFYDDTGAVAAAIPLIILVIFLVLLQRWIMRNHTYFRITPASETTNPIRLGKFRCGAICLLIFLFIITTVLPFLSVLAGAQSFAKIVSTLHSSCEGILNTSILALSAAVISTVIAFPIGCHLVHNRSSFTRMLDIICWLPIAIPGTIMGLGIIKLTSSFLALQRNDSFGLLLLLAYMGMFSAFSIRIFEAAHRRADPNITEAAVMDCPRWYQKFFYVDIPLHARAIAASIIMVFVLVIGELNATVLLIPPGKATLAVSVDNLLHYGANATASALCLIEAGLVILAAVLGLIFWSIARRILR